MSINNTLNQAITMQSQGRIDDAVALFKTALDIDQNNAAALYSLALITLNSGRFDDAYVLSSRGVKAAPSFAPLHFVHGAILQSLGRKEEALRNFDDALNLDPNYVAVLLNSGAMLRSMFRHKEALERFNKRLAIEPNHVGALGNCGILLTEFKQSEQAIALFERLIQLDPEYDYGLGLLFYERMHICDWTGFDALSKQIVDGVRNGKRVCKSLAFMAASENAKDHQLAAKLFADQYCPKKAKSMWNGERYRHDKIRLAYISPDLREHPVGHLMAGIFEHHDKSRFETIAISLGIDDQSRLRARMLKSFDQFIDARDMGSEQIAQLMRDMEVDIAVDLGGYTSDTRTEVLAYRPAPVQVNYLGYPGTMGTDYIDYIVADRHIIPPEHQSFYNEKVVYLPDTYLPTDSSLRISARTPSRAECGLPDTGFVFCSFNHDHKISPTMFAVWMRLLVQVPGSVLWLMSRSEVSQHNLQKAAREQGVDPSRLIFATRVPLVEDHLARYRQADVFLDTHPYNAHTTAADALMAGLPVITYMGNSFPSRVAGSLLHAINMPELITHSLADYEQLALKLATSSIFLSDIKLRLQNNKSACALFDTEGFCRNFEAMLISLAPASAVLAVQEAHVSPKRSDEVVAELDVAAELVKQGNFSQAELYIRRYQSEKGPNSFSVKLLEAVGLGYGFDHHFQLSEKRVPSNQEIKFLLIREWGYGFWSDVHHVLSGLLVAELTHRQPIVYWGAQSLFSDASASNAFELYFEPVSSVKLTEITSSTSIFPPKWHQDNLLSSDIDRWQGSFSRLSAPFLFNRQEKVVVSDFYSTLSSIIPWIASDSSYFGLSDDEIYIRLCEKYLNPVQSIRNKAEAFFTLNMAGRPWVAVHARGSDKIFEAPQLKQANEQYFAFVDRVIELNPTIGVFLLTDSVEIYKTYQSIYGERLLTTPALRTDSNVGIHYLHPGLDVGNEVLLDVLIAINCDYFIGNKETNVSLAISSLKRWPANYCFLFGSGNVRADNWFLHKDHLRTDDECNQLTFKSNSEYKKTVLFFNDWHNGDLHMSRPYVLDMMSLLGDCNYYFYHKNNPKLLSDIDNLVYTPTKIAADLTIDTWLGQFQYKGMSIEQMSGVSSITFGANFPCYYSVMAKVYESLNLSRFLKPVDYYLPTISYDHFDVENIQRYFDGKKTRSMLICNNVPMSGQAPAVDFREVVAELAVTYPQIDFLISNDDANMPKLNNIVSCKEIIGNPSTICDLNEISYISTFCNVIVGRSSGPYSFSVTKDNLATKQFVCISNEKKDTWFLDESTNILWSNNGASSNVVSMLSGVIKSSQ